MFRTRLLGRTGCLGHELVRFVVVLVRCMFHKSLLGCVDESGRSFQI